MLRGCENPYYVNKRKTQKGWVWHWNLLNCALNGQFHNCQSWSFITVEGQLLAKTLGLSLPGKKTDLVNTKESVLHGCDKPYYMNKRIAQKGLWGDWSFAELCIESAVQMGDCKTHHFENCNQKCHMCSISVSVSISLLTRW